ncbi:MAG: CBS domain-containing protein [Azonexus sp.]|nr:CBS domain-containing protein [Azonexus sp.]MCK6412559.1 CBS domain-containing protein [Azonexus sp.]
MPRRMISQVIAGQTLLTASPATSVRAAAEAMAERRVGAVLVLEAGRLAGIFTERDALTKVLAAGLDADATSLVQVMVANPQTIAADKPLAYALLMMVDGGFRHVPVVDAAGVPIGMVSARDALGQDMVELERDLDRLSELEKSIGY